MYGDKSGQSAPRCRNNLLHVTAHLLLAAGVGLLTSCHFLSAAFNELQSTVLRATQSQICWWSSRFCSLNHNAAQIVLWSLISRRGETLSKPAADYRLSVCVRACMREKVCVCGFGQATLSYSLDIFAKKHLEWCSVVWCVCDLDVGRIVVSGPRLYERALTPWKKPGYGQRGRGLYTLMSQPSLVISLALHKDWKHCETASLMPLFLQREAYFSSCWADSVLCAAKALWAPCIEKTQSRSAGDVICILFPII